MAWEINVPSSSCLDEIRYETTTRVMRLAFDKNAGVFWEYEDIPESVWSELAQLRAGVGKWFNDHIRKVYKGRRISELAYYKRG